MTHAVCVENVNVCVRRNPLSGTVINHTLTTRFEIRHDYVAKVIYIVLVSVVAVTITFCAPVLHPHCHLLAPSCAELHATDTPYGVRSFRCNRKMMTTSMRARRVAKGEIAPTGNFCFKTIVDLIPHILIITKFYRDPFMKFSKIYYIFR
jgi:hypothetical protein